MRVSLVVAEGVHQGKSIPITVTEFLIGRDPECQLRPASPQVSKKHCAVVVRDGKVYVRDFGSTNGTFINDEQVAGDREVNSGDRFRAGPLAFDIRIETVTAAPAKPASSPATSTTATPPASITAPAVASVSTKTPVSTDKPKSKSSPVISAPVAQTPAEDLEDSEKMAALLLGGDDGSGDVTIESSIPDGTTAMDLPAVPGADKKDDKKKPDADTSSAAAAILSKYMRRPRS